MVCKICYTTLQHNLNTHMGVSKHILPFYSFLKINTLDLFTDVWFATKQKCCLQCYYKKPW